MTDKTTGAAIYAGFSILCFCLMRTLGTITEIQAFGASGKSITVESANGITDSINGILLLSAVNAGFATIVFFTAMFTNFSRMK